jgi:hypothetical protein
MTCSIRNLLIFEHDCRRSRVRAVRKACGGFSRLFWLVLAGGILIFGTGIANAQGSIISRGDDVVTGFSGINFLGAGTKPDADPLEEFSSTSKGRRCRFFGLAQS